MASLLQRPARFWVMFTGPTTSSSRESSGRRALDRRQHRQRKIHPPRCARRRPAPASKLPKLRRRQHALVAAPWRRARHTSVLKHTICPSGASAASTLRAALSTCGAACTRAAPNRNRARLAAPTRPRGGAARPATSPRNRKPSVAQRGGNRKVGSEHGHLAAVPQSSERARRRCRRHRPAKMRGRSSVTHLSKQPRSSTGLTLERRSVCSRCVQSFLVGAARAAPSAEVNSAEPPHAATLELLIVNFVTQQNVCSRWRNPLPAGGMDVGVPSHRLLNGPLKERSSHAQDQKAFERLASRCPPRLNLRP